MTSNKVATIKGRYRVSEQDSQQGSGENEKQEAGGLEFMSRRFNVVNHIFELSVTRKITPAERNLIDLIEIGTSGAMNEKKQFCTKAEFYLEDLSKALRYKDMAKIWRLLKSLQTKGIITREKTRSINKELLGLNPEMMGQILINSLHQEETKRHLKLAVDNSKTERTNHSQPTNESFVIGTRTVRDHHTNRSRSDTQEGVTINEKPLLDSSRLILNSSRGENENPSCTLLEEDWDPEGPAKAAEILKMVRMNSMPKVGS